MNQSENTYTERSGAIGSSLFSGQDSPYSILNIAPTATKAEIREAYVRLKSSFSAGGAALYSLMNDDQIQINLNKIEEAFRILNDDHRRHLLDKTNPVDNINSATQVADPATASLPMGKSATRQQSHSTSISVVSTAKSAVVRAGLANDPKVQELMQIEIANSDPSDGDLFKRLRTCCKVEESEIVDRTKVHVEYLRAVESNHFDRLPQAVFVKGFLKSYLNYLGIKDADKLASAFSERLKNWQKEHKK